VVEGVARLDLPGPTARVATAAQGGGQEDHQNSHPRSRRTELAVPQREQGPEDEQGEAGGPGRTVAGPPGLAEGAGHLVFQVLVQNFPRGDSDGLQPVVIAGEGLGQGREVLFLKTGADVPAVAVLDPALEAGARILDE